MEVDQIDQIDGWMKPLYDYLSKGILPTSKTEARKIKLKSVRYEIRDGILYRKSYLNPMMRCLSPYEADYALREAHEGICGSHIGYMNLVKKLTLLGYYWPTMKADAEQLVHKCERCQVHSTIPWKPGADLTPMVSPWPFAQWGIDLLGPFPKAPGGFEHLIVAVDYFTKWVEAEPLTSISEKAVRRFFLQEYHLPIWNTSVSGFRQRKTV